MAQGRDASHVPDPLNDANEHTSLLSKPRSLEQNAQGLRARALDSTGAVATEFWLLLRTSLPVILAYTLQNSLQTMSVVIVGRMSPEALATAAFSYMFAMSTAWLVALGGTTAIDTLASAAHGSGDRDVGVIFQRALFTLTAFYVPVAVLWFFSEPLFILLGQEAWLARDASRFLMALSPGGLGYVFFESLKKFLQAQGKLADFSLPVQKFLLALHFNVHRVLPWQKSCEAARTFC